MSDNKINNNLTAMGLPADWYKQQPVYDCSFKEAVIRFFTKAFTQKGRASRSEYWWFMLFDILVSIVIQTIGGIMPDSIKSIFSMIYLIYMIAIIIPFLLLFVRRLHDIGKGAGWAIGLIFAMIAGYIMVAIGGFTSFFFFIMSGVVSPIILLPIIGFILILASVIISFVFTVMKSKTDGSNLKWDKYYDMYSDPKISDDMIALPNNINDFKNRKNAIMNGVSQHANNMNNNSMNYNSNTGMMSFNGSGDDEDDYAYNDEDDDMSYNVIPNNRNNNAQMPVQNQQFYGGNNMQAMNQRMRGNNARANRMNNAPVPVNNNQQYNQPQPAPVNRPVHNANINNANANNMSSNRANAQNNTVNRGNATGRLSRARMSNTQTDSLSYDEHVRAQKQKKIDDLYNTDFSLDLGEQDNGNSAPQAPVYGNSNANKAVNSQNPFLPNNPANSNFIRRQ